MYSKILLILAKKIPYIESKSFHEIAGRNQLMSARLEDISLLQSMNRNAFSLKPISRFEASFCFILAL